MKQQLAVLTQWPTTMLQQFLLPRTILVVAGRVTLSFDADAEQPEPRALISPTLQAAAARPVVSV